MSYKFNPITGTLDYFEDTPGIDPADLAARRLEDIKTYAETISALKVVRAVNDTDVVTADTTSYSGARALGVALDTGLTGDKKTIQLFGKLEDPFFNFPVQEPLFFDDLGTITDVPPTIYSTTIGYSLGAGAIFIDIENPIEL